MSTGNSPGPRGNRRRQTRDDPGPDAGGQPVGPDGPDGPDGQDYVFPAAGDSVPDKPSKTQRKKAMHALQALGERLVGLPQSRLDDLPLEEDLRRAVDHARSIRSHEGRRRQLQFIGKLMRSIDAAGIEAALAGDDASHARQVAAHHAAEQWRDGLIAGQRKIAAFVQQFGLPSLATSGGSTAAASMNASDAGPEAGAATHAPAAAAPGPRTVTNGLNEADLTSLVEAARKAAAAGGANPRPARALYRALHQSLLAREGNGS